MFEIVFGAFLATAGYGILFNIERRFLLLGGLCGAIGGFVYILFQNVIGNEFTALFLGSLCVSITAEILARKYRTPVTTFVVCGIIPLVPGGTMYYTMLEVVKGNNVLAMELVVQSLSYAGAVALALILVSSATRVIFANKRKSRIV